jgi:hypothetical protein
VVFYSKNQVGKRSGLVASVVCGQELCALAPLREDILEKIHDFPSNLELLVGFH